MRSDGPKPDKFAPVSSAMLVEALRDGHHLICRPLRISALYFTPQDAWEHPETRTEKAADLAADRIEALEAKLASMEAWQDGLIELLLVKGPSSVPAENWMGWRLLCEEARTAYRVIVRYVGAAIAQREREEFEQNAR